MLTTRPPHAFAVLCGVLLAVTAVAPATGATTGPAGAESGNETVSGEVVAVDRSKTGTTTPVRDGIASPFSGNTTRITDDRYVRIVETRAEAVATFNSRLDSGVRQSIVNGTDFTSSYLVVYQEARASPHPVHRIEKAVRTGPTLRVTVNNTCVEGCVVPQVVVVETVIMQFDRNGSRARPSFVVVEGLNSSYTRITAGNLVREEILTYDENGDARISGDELLAAAREYRDGELTFAKLGRVAAAFARSPADG